MGLLSLYLYCFIVLESSYILCTLTFRRLVSKHSLLGSSVRKETHRGISCLSGPSDHRQQAHSQEQNLALGGDQCL